MIILKHDGIPIYPNNSAKINENSWLVDQYKTNYIQINHLPPFNRWPNDFAKGVKTIQQEKDRLFNKWCREH